MAAPKTARRAVCPAGRFRFRHRCVKETAGKPTARAGSDHFLQHGLDAEEAVVLGGALAAAGGTGFDLAAGGGYRQVGDGGVLRFAAAVAEDGPIAGLLRQRHRFQRFGQGAHLVGLDEDGIGGAAGKALLQPGLLGDKKVIPDELNIFADGFGELPPQVPVILPGGGPPTK